MDAVNTVDPERPEPALADPAPSAPSAPGSGAGAGAGLAGAVADAGHARRADAQRNQRRVLDAAVEVFDAEGVGAPMEAIATRAGVGVGTVYRHFPTKEELVRAAVSRVYEDLVASARAALDEPDPGQGFGAFLTMVVAFQAQHRALAQEMASDVEPDVDTTRLKHGLRSVISELLTRAQAAGEVRPDVGVTDIAMLLSGLAHGINLASEEPDLQGRYLQVMLDGLSPTGARSLPGKVLGYPELDRLHERRRAELARRHPA